jgi:S-adenosylmethionine:tRNA ribosyltransferase-isomerase
MLSRETGGAVEVFLLRKSETGWRVLLRPAKRVRPGEALRGEGNAFAVRVQAKSAGEATVQIEGLPEEEVLERFGQVPLPPYIRRAPVPEDRSRYQTVFARVPGAVAAPTAGLHFDEEALRSVEAREVSIARLVLHVGAGTFRPLPEGELDERTLEAEPYEIPEPTIRAVERTKARGHRVVACGTTVVRALETWARAESGRGALGDTNLFIFPPFEFRVVDALLTNFHLPRSSLLCLVAAFSGRERILAAYREAIREGYRFYSYGDATFLEGRL